MKTINDKDFLFDFISKTFAGNVMLLVELSIDVQTNIDNFIIIENTINENL